MLQTRLGAEIDQHEFVIRTNLAPVGGFEEIVGSKTSARVMNSEALITVMAERMCPQLSIDQPSFCDGLNYGIYINSGHWGVQASASLAAACGDDAPISPVLNRSHLTVDDPIIRHFAAGNSKNVMTGAWAIALAMYLCPNGVDVYGYTHSGVAKMARGSQYH